MLSGGEVERNNSVSPSCMVKKMNRLLVSFAIVAASLCSACAADVGLLPVKEADDAVSKAFKGAKPVEKNALSVTRPAKKKKKGKPTADILAGLKDDDILVDIEGVFRLKWGLLRKHVEVLCKGVDDRPDMQASGNEAVKSVAFQTFCWKLLKDYVQHGVFALEARRLGIKVDEAEFQTYRQQAREAYARKGKMGEAMIKLMNSGESFYEHNLTNALYWKAFREKEIEPKIELPEEDVHRFIEMRHTRNLNVLATNNFKRVLIGNVRAQVKDGMDFGEAAEKWSEDDSAETKGVMMDDNGETPRKFAKDDLDERIASQCWHMKPGELSGVIETPYAWSIVKVLKRNPATADDEETIEFAQIKLEKEFLEPEFSEQEARDKARAFILRSAMIANFAELMKKTHIDCKIPLDSGSRGGRPILKKRTSK